MTHVDPSCDADWPGILRQLTETWPQRRWENVGVVVGCSGGADSVALLRALASVRDGSAQGFLIAAHFNHGLRGTESNDDERFVRDLADRLAIRFERGEVEHARSDEATMRRQRMSFLVQTARRSGARYVATAHTVDDNVETVVHQLLRGTGPAGLSGMPCFRPLDDDLVLARPLLALRRSQLRRGLIQLEQPWREDSSNQEVHYRRNWIRHHLLPLIESQYPLAVEAIERTIDGQQKWRAHIDRQAAQWLTDHADRDARRIARDPTADEPIVIAAMQRVWDQQGWSRGEMNREHWLRLVSTIAGDEDQRYALPGAIDVQATGRWVTLNDRS